MITYQELARREDVTICEECDWLTEYAHRDGRAEPSIGVVHWRLRRATRMGLRTFLKLVASIKFHHQRAKPRWLKLYEMNAYAYEVAEGLSIRLPRRLSASDRAWIRWYAGSHPHTVPAHIIRWANRKD